jgi:hypothetical protein
MVWPHLSVVMHSLLVYKIERMTTYVGTSFSRF